MLEDGLDVEVLDTTLRDGAQTSGVSFTLQEKLMITEKLDELGVSYIEGGWPGSNPKDLEYFKRVKELSLENSEIAVFGSTRKRDVSPKDDENLNSLISADVRIAVIFGKSWKLHVNKVLKASEDENLEMIRDSIEYLRAHGVRVFFDAEHFFDGYKDDPGYALEVVKTAWEAGAERIVLADTNGGAMVHELQSIVREVRERMSAPLGIHTHNDSGMAVANTIVAVVEGVVHVQGTINGIGERCGNADLVQILPALQLKLGLRALKSRKPVHEQLKGLTKLSRYLYQVLNMQENPYQPYVGSRAFAHKGGVHVDAVMKIPRAYEHIDPGLVGNRRQLVVSELAGRAAVLNQALSLGLKLEKQSEAVKKTLEEVKALEAQGYLLDGSNATINLILLRNLGINPKHLSIVYWGVAVAREESGSIESVGDVIVRAGSEVRHGRGRGVGPVHALDNALRAAVGKLLPEILKVSLVNYKVSVVDSVEGTASKVRVLIEFTDGVDRWSTTSLSRNILEASINALIDGYNYKLVLDKLRERGVVLRT